MGEVFFLTLNSMLYFIIIMTIGYVANKMKLFPQNFDVVLSRLLSMIVTPALIIKSFYEKFRIDVLSEKLYIFLLGLCIVALSYLISITISGFFTKDDYIKKVYRYSFTTANFGYMGYVLIEMVFGSDALFNMIVFTIPFNIYSFTLGLTSLNPECKKISFDNLKTPVFYAMIVGIVLGLTTIPLPEVILDSLNGITSTLGPLAMLVTGFIIAKYKITDIIKDYKVYIATVIRLVVIPTFIIFILKLVNVNEEIIIVALCSVAMPFGLNGIIFPAAYGGNTKPGAGMALISDVLAIVTIPLMFLLFNIGY